MGKDGVGFEINPEYMALTTRHDNLTRVLFGGDTIGQLRIIPDDPTPFASIRTGSVRHLHHLAALLGHPHPAADGDTKAIRNYGERVNKLGASTTTRTSFASWSTSLAGCWSR